MSETSPPNQAPDAVVYDAPTAIRRKVQKAIGGGAQTKIGDLLSLYDSLAASTDPYIQFAAGWAALYASQKPTSHGDVDSYFDLAKERWTQATVEAESMFDDSPTSLSLKAQLCLTMAPQIRREKAIWTPQQRQNVCTKIGEVAGKCIPHVEKNDAAVKGLLAEIACLQLLWRDHPCTPLLNSVPAGPGKDSRPGMTRFGTDIYSFVPGTKPSQKGVNVQVKSTVRQEQADKYDPSVIVQIVVVRHFKHPNRNNAKPTERILYVAQSCINELDDAETENEARVNLDKSSQNIHSDIMRSMRARHPEAVKIPHQPLRPPAVLPSFLRS